MAQITMQNNPPADGYGVGYHLHELTECISGLEAAIINHRADITELRAQAHRLFALTNELDLEVMG